MASRSRRSRHRPKRPIQGLSPQIVTVLIVMSSLMIAMIIAANLAAMKIWNFYSIPIDGGIVMFPITYILGDLLVEIYGKRIANTVATCSFVLGLSVCGLLWIVTLLPNYPGADNSGFTVVSQLASRITIASLVAFLVSQRVNNAVFVFLRNNSIIFDEQDFKSRAFLSSITAHLVDSLLFETIAFLGRLPFNEFFGQAVFAYLASMPLEAALLPLTNYLANSLRHKLGFSNGKYL